MDTNYSRGKRTTDVTDLTDCGQTNFTRRTPAFARGYGVASEGHAEGNRGGTHESRGSHESRLGIRKPEIQELDFGGEEAFDRMNRIFRIEEMGFSR
jgi:hypothetical protein